jgi:hypothetical protein
MDLVTVFILLHRTSNEISDIVADLKRQGYSVGEDFDFEYSPGHYEWATSEHRPRQTKFTFYNQNLAIWFVIKWS